MNDRMTGKKILLIASGLVFLIVLPCSAFFILHEANHDCTGDSCPICACIHLAEQTSRQLYAETAMQARTPLPPPLPAAMLIPVAVLATHPTLIKQKTRIND